MVVSCSMHLQVERKRETDANILLDYASCTKTAAKVGRTAAVHFEILHIV